MTRSRIAPTPSGYLHIGNALNFLLIWLWVRREGGILRLRIDDRDTPRSKPEHVEDIFRSLDWMELDWDEGPQTPDKLYSTYSQTLRVDRYEAMTQRLIDTGKVFACDCSRKEMQTHSCTCRAKNIPLDRADTALRISTTAEPIIVQDIKRGALSVTLEKDLKDFIIRRRDGMTAYQLASLADDIDYGTNLIIRGEDLLTSTAAQLYLASLIGIYTNNTATMPSLRGMASLNQSPFINTKFYHHEMVTDEQGQKLSKSSGSPSLRAMRESGMDREKLYIRLSELMGLKEKYTSPEEMLKGDFPL